MQKKKEKKRNKTCKAESAADLRDQQQCIRENSLRHKITEGNQGQQVGHWIYTGCECRFIWSASLWTLTKTPVESLTAPLRLWLQDARPLAELFSWAVTFTSPPGRSVRATLGERRACERTLSVLAVCQTNSSLAPYLQPGRTSLCVFTGTHQHTAVHSCYSYSSDGTRLREKCHNINHSRYILFNERLGTEFKYLPRPDPRPERGRALSSWAIKCITHYPSGPPPAPPPNTQTPDCRRQQDECEQADLTWKLFGRVESH